LRFHGNGVELGTHTREQFGRRGCLLRAARCGGEEQPRRKKVRAAFFSRGEIQCPPLSRISNSFAVHICSSYPVQKQKLRSPKLL
jgi:hypothetical protein